MKDTLTVSIPASGTPSTLDTTRIAETTVCHNLRSSRSSTGRQVLHPAGSPAIVARGPWKPLAIMSLSDGRGLLVVSSGLTLAATPSDSSDDEPATIATLPGEALCATVDGLRVTVMTADGPFTVRYDESASAWIVNGLRKRFAALSLMAEETADCSSTVGSRKLSTSYPSGIHALRDSDLKAVSGDMRRAYRDICAMAAAQGAYIAPLLCRYRLIDHEGTAVFTSQPLLLGAKDGYHDDILMTRALACMPCSTPPDTRLRRRPTNSTGNCGNRPTNHPHHAPAQQATTRLPPIGQSLCRNRPIRSRILQSPGHPRGRTLTRPPIHRPPRRQGQ